MDASSADTPSATRSSAKRADLVIDGVIAKSYGFSWRIVAAIDGMAELVRAAVRSLFRRRARLEAEIAATRSGELRQYQGQLA